MSNKRVLYQMLDNPLSKNHGNKTWSLQLLQYFKERDIAVDFVSDREWGMWSDSDIATFQQTGLADRLFVLDRKPSKKNILRYFLSHKLPEFFIKKKAGFYKAPIYDHITRYYQKQFDNILKKNSYDFVLINYVTCASLIHNNPYLKGATTIIDTHDFFTSQHQHHKNFDIGASFKEEMRRLSWFDMIWTVSTEEHYIFSQFCKNDVRLVQTMLDKPSVRRDFKDKKYDIIYVASDIRHNQLSAEWFFKQVYPLLPSDIKICVIGKITRYIDDYPNVEKILFVDDLADYYTQAKVAICPMLSGTGIKIKVVEALSFGLPIVCNHRGLDGLLNKVNNGCIATNDATQFASAIQQLLHDTAFYERQSHMASATFDLFFAKEQAYQRLDNIFGITQTS